MVVLTANVAIATPPSVMVFENKEAGIRVEIHETECKSTKVLGFIKKDYQKLFHSAKVVVDGKAVDACWAFPPNQVEIIALVTAEGQTAELPIQVFKVPEVI